MTDQGLKTFPCDICGSDDCAEIESVRQYTGGHPLHVCKECGLVFVRERRSFEAIAETWSKELYGNRYTARIPAVKARQTHVVDTADVWFDLRGKDMCDIGAGEGQFLEMAQSAEYGAHVFGVEPSQANCESMDQKGFNTFCGTIEDYMASSEVKSDAFDIVSIMWTLENCASPVGMMKSAHALCRDGGHVVVGTGSRILVPFKKPMGMYFLKRHQDYHSFHLSRNTLARGLMMAGFEVTHENRFIDTDYLVMGGAKRAKDYVKEAELPKDDWREILDFFDRWHHETQAHYPEYLA